MEGQKRLPDEMASNIEGIMEFTLTIAPAEQNSNYSSPQTV